MRTYEKTHPWLTFQLDLRQASARLWMLLGEARSKCDHIAGTPLRLDTARRLYAIYLAKGVHATTAIEGNTLSEEEVKARLDGQRTLPFSKEYLGQEVDAIIKAFDYVENLVLHRKADYLSVEMIKTCNRLVLENTRIEADVVPGEISSHSVVVAKYLGAPREDCDYLLEQMCRWLNESSFLPVKGDQRVPFGLLRAIMAHLYLAWIHPFGDGNGRTARLLEFQILLAAGVPSPAAHLLSNHYNETRQEYYRQLDFASRSGGQALSFIEYALQGFVDGLKGQLEAIRRQQWDIAWKDYVYSFFQGKESAADVRRRHLILDLSSKTDPVPFHEIRRVSPRVAEDYAAKTQKTLSRDLNELIAMNLIERTPRGFRARRESILAFLPPRQDI